jgi:DNA-binding NarL/FixJ family response regulator
VEHLTPKEIQTLELLIAGDSNREIAVKMHLSESTVKLHLRNIMEKFHLRNRVQIAVYAMRHGIIPPSSTS